MTRRSRCCSISSTAIACGLIFAFGCRVHAASPPEYNRDIRPILADHCFACHGADSASREAELRLDLRDEAIAAGAITPGEPDESTLIERVISDDPDVVMPPPAKKKPLTEAQKRLLREWVAAGAEFQPHWSFIAPRRPAIPQVSRTDWPKNEIDHFTLAALEKAGLEPARAADARTLFRRLHLDITGLPPAPDDVRTFVADYARDTESALSEWIDKLIQRPAWGEHRARYWLDAARYGDTHGLHFDNYREMWPYRDWVIRSFNANQPFDQFTIEQLAGDLLPNPTDDQLIATGFQRCNITTNEGGTIAEENLANYAVDRVQTFGWVYLGLTTNCGQCHDHKFDPLKMKDFYSLAAFFRNTTQDAYDGNAKDGRGPVIVVPSEQDRARWEAIPQELAETGAAREARRAAARPQFGKWLDTLSPESQAARIPSAGLVLHVPLDEGQGNQVTGVAEAPETATADGDVSWIVDGKLGAAPVVKTGRTFAFENAGDFERDQPFSFGCWARTARETNASIIARMDEQAKHRGWDLWQNGRDFAVHIVDAWPDNSLKVTTRDGAVKIGQWQHVFVTYDGSGKPEGVKVFVDGVNHPLNTTNNTLKPDASIRTSTPLRIGQRSQAAVFEDGAVQDCRIYDRLVSDSEVKSLFEGTVFQAIVSVPPAERSDAQQAQLFEHYLSTQDPEYQRLVASIADLEREREAIRGRSPVTHIQQEKPNSPAMAHILMRGAYDKPGDQVSAMTPAALHPLPEDARPDRLGLARWVVDPANPLTARVTVNRFWQEVFGRGIVATPEDFGTMGAPPSHPELLDWLAVEFRESGWDVKRLFKLMLMSATYRQAAIVTAEKIEKDRDNILLSRGPRFRMDAEMIRDYALATSGLLVPTMYGPGTRPYQPEGIWDIVGLPGGDTRNYVQDQGQGLYRRTLYTFWKRMAPPPNLETFNAPSREVCTVRRERTNTPLQALVTLNDPQFVEAARRLAENAMTAGGNDETAVAATISDVVLCRRLNDAEAAIVLESYHELLTFYQADEMAAKALVSVGDSPVADTLDVAQLAAWTMICNQFMNLDEVLNK